MHTIDTDAGDTHVADDGTDAPPCPGAPAEERRYRSAFRSWDTRSWIRTKPHRTAPFERGLLFFSPDGDGSRDSDDVAERCIRRLQAHLAMTVRLELGPVNDACLVLRDSPYARWLPRQLRDDALRLYADEAGHAEMTNEMASDVERATGIAPPTATPPFVRCVADLVAAADPDRRDLVRFLGGVVSETLVTVTLTRVPLDDRVQLAVRQLLADHADDERRHAALFRDAFSYVWPRLAPDVRHAGALLVPQLVLAFLELEHAELAAAAAEPILRLFHEAGTPVPMTVSA
jgi:hypothetical protein